MTGSGAGHASTASIPHAIHMCGGVEVHLTPTEYDVLKYLVQHVDRVVTHRTLLSAVWGSEFADQTPMLRSFIKQVRQKIEADPSGPHLIVTEPGVGYRLRRNG